MKNFTKKIIGSISQSGPIGDFIDKICVYYHKRHENLNYDSTLNGEDWMIQKLASMGINEIFFDVGANKGEWVEAALRYSPSSTVHCFEAVPETYRKLLTRIRESDRVIINNVGLSDKSETKLINYCPNQDGLSSLYTIVLPEQSSPVPVQLVESKSYCINKGIKSIDFLKIDTEGAEFSILKGFDDMLHPDKIKVIQFEYGFVNASIGILLKDFYELLESRGYVIGKLFPKHVRFRNYSVFEEDFFGPNYIATSPEISKSLV